MCGGGRKDGSGDHLEIIRAESHRKDQISNSRTTTEEDSAGGTRVEKEGETEKTSIYQQREDGSQTPYVSREMLPEVEGVAVIAEGGDRSGRRAKYHGSDPGIIWDRSA